MPSPEGAAVSSSPGLALNEWGGGGRETGGGEGKEGLEGEEEGEGTYGWDGREGWSQVDGRDILFFSL